MTVNLTDKFIKDLCCFKDRNSPETVILQAKRCLLDYLGAAFAGAGMLDAKGKKLLQSLGGGQSRDAAVIGFNRKAGIETAVFMNGISAHVAELDDGVISGIVHPGSPIFSALLPVAEKEKVSGKELISGIISGYEAAVRLADAIQPAHKKRGFHGTGTCGTIGAAMGIGTMLGFSETQMKSAVSAAAVTASGSLKVLEDESELKPFNVGRAASGGFLAAIMAQAGFNGPDDVFSGDRGFLHMMGSSYDLAQLENSVNGVFKIEKVYIKPFASCRYTHPAVDAVLRIRTEHPISPETIASVKVKTYFWAVANHDHTTISGPSSAKMSIPYSVAVALITGKAGLEEFSEKYVNNSEISALTQKIMVEPDEKLTELFPRKTAAIVDILTRDGNCYSARIDCPKGEPENPLSNSELEEKFISLATFGNKTPKEINKIIETVWQLETRLPELFDLI
ncbi:MmgE/PrpD family protein [Desulfobacter latus]|uniref:MmgE/PrpD family protein n=1 Tax=Desulfobacter latus TaxID=2292 RepID=A0A850T0E8_9BACT|nr:MmgE/PrpD family protein [Desulfobacter latus]NWH05800.1 MmgE/PrpD family protein [Desulfobacter latus]